MTTSMQAKVTLRQLLFLEIICVFVVLALECHSKTFLSIVGSKRPGYFRPTLSHWRPRPRTSPTTGMPCFDLSLATFSPSVDSQSTLSARAIRSGDSIRGQTFSACLSTLWTSPTLVDIYDLRMAMWRASSGFK